MANRDALKKFLEDNTQFTDATEVRIGNEVTTLGDLRSLNSEERTQLSTALKTAGERQTEIEKRQGEISALAVKAQQAYEAAEEARSRAASQQTRVEPGADWREDPWAKPIAKEIAERDKKYVELATKLDTMIKIVGNAANIFSEDRWEREYSSINFGNREKKPTLEDLKKFASDQGIKDRHGIPSVRAAWEKMSEADRLKDLEMAAFERGKDAQRAESMAARMPAPGVPGPGMSGTIPKVDPTKGELGDLYAEANKDPELRALMEQMGSFVQ